MHMQWRNSTERYGTVAQVLHWTIFVLVALQFASAWVVDAFPRASDERAMVITLHESLGLAALTLVAIRLFWRVVNPTPAGDGLPWQRRVARATHAALYVLMVAVPVAGYVTALARGHDLAWFGIALPQLLGADRALSRTAMSVHEFLGWTLLAFIGVHAAAALWHHVVARDATLRRMLPRRTGIELGWRR